MDVLPLKFFKVDAHHPISSLYSCFKSVVFIMIMILSEKEKGKKKGNSLLCKSFPLQVVFHLSIYNTSVQDFLHNKFFRLCLFNFFTFAILFFSHFVLQKKFRTTLFFFFFFALQLLHWLINTKARSSDSFHVSACGQVTWAKHVNLLGFFFSCLMRYPTPVFKKVNFFCLHTQWLYSP